MGYVKEDDMKVGKYIENTAKALGGKIAVAEICRFEKGEGIQKKEEDFAAEIEKLASGK
jgi:elongation factor Ts